MHHDSGEFKCSPNLPIGLINFNQNANKTGLETFHNEFLNSWVSTEVKQQGNLYLKTEVI